MKFCVLIIGNSDIVRGLISAHPRDCHYFHKIESILVKKSIPYSVDFFDRDDPKLMEQFTLPDRLVYGYQILPKEAV